MTEKELIDEYPILGDDDFGRCKRSILRLADVDDLMDDRGFMIDRFNEFADTDDDQFFYDMLPCVVYIYDGESTAYTTPDKKICLHYPNTDIVPQDNDKVQRWYFVYCHECMHQLWNTFAVGDEIAKAKGKCNYRLLNIASDCVINDYLANIAKSHKKPPINGVTPEYIKETYGIEYDRKLDTQYSLYMQLDERLDEAQKQALMDKFDKIKPKEVKKVKMPPQPPRPPQDQMFPDDFVKGWRDAIIDVTKNHVDARTAPKKKTGNDNYDRGYNTCMAQIKEGLEKGITIGKGAGKQPKDRTNLPPIPWDIDNDDDDSDGGDDGDSNDAETADDAEKAAKDAEQQAKEAQDAADKADKDNKEAAQKAADKAKKAAQRARDAANKAKEAAVKGAGNGSSLEKEAAQEAADAAKEAAEAAQEAKAAGRGGNIDKIKRNATNAAAAAARARQAADELAEKARNSNDAELKAAAREAQEAADRAEKAAVKAAVASNAGDQKAEETAADEAIKAADEALHAAHDAVSKGAGSGSDIDDELDDILKRKAEKTIKKYADAISGKLGSFVEKCKVSRKLKDTGLRIQSMRGNASWPKELEMKCKDYVFQKLRSRRMYHDSYQRWKRGEEVYTDADLENGRLIHKGRKVKKDKIGFDLSMYMDISGSMSGVLSKVFETAYSVMDILHKEFSHIPAVDADKIVRKSYVFDTQMQEIPYGKKHGIGGGTYEFDALLSDVYKNGSSSFLNIIITDGNFDTIKPDEIAEAINNMEGLFIIVTNNPNRHTFDDAVFTVKRKCGEEKLAVIYTDENFNI